MNGMDRQKQNLICRCGHFEYFHYDGEHLSFDEPLRGKRLKYCTCEQFIPDNLKYLELKYLEWKYKEKYK
jgi:hypothetical protein